MSNFKCKYCGMTVPVYKHVGPHMGEWCHFCGKWQRWIPKNEIVKCNISPVKTIVETQLLKDDLKNYNIGSATEEEEPF